MSVLDECQLNNCVFASTRRFSANNPTTPVGLPFGVVLVVWVRVSS